MATTDLMVGIGAEYKGRGAFKKAEKDILGLNKGVKQLAKAYVGLAGAQKAFSYASSSVKAFVQDDKAARQLSKTVGNLGLAYEATNVENFIQGLEKTYHINDDFLRPSFAKLIQVTQSYTKSKELLTTAINASAGAGVDLTTTVQDLSQAYVGNLRGLRKYNLGLTQAELATMTFQQIQDKLNATFTGQGALAADTYAGKMDALAIASNNAKEIIGKGLVDAITTAFGGGEIDKATANMEKMAGFAADFARAIGTSLKYSGANLIGKVFGSLGKKRAELATKDRKYDPMSGKVQDITPAGLKAIAARAKVDAAAAKRQKELAALIGKQTKAIKEQTALAKAKAILDQTSLLMNMDLIQNVAALQGKVTEDQTLRLRLQQAILLGNSEAAAKLGQELLSVQLAAVMASSVDPFGKFTDSAKAAMEAIKNVIAELEKLGQPAVMTPQLLLAKDYVSVLKDAQDVSYQLAQDETNAALAGLAALSNLPKLPGLPGATSSTGYTQPTGNFTYGQGNPLNVKVFVDPSAMAYGISAAVIDNSSNGNSNTYRTIQSYAGGM